METTDFGNTPVADFQIVISLEGSQNTMMITVAAGYLALKLSNPSKETRVAASVAADDLRSFPVSELECWVGQK